MEAQAKAVIVLCGLILLLGFTFVGASAAILHQYAPSGTELAHPVGLAQTTTPDSRWPSWCANPRLGGRWLSHACVVELVDYATQATYVCQGVETAPSRFWPQDLPANILPMCVERGTNIAYAKPWPGRATQVVVPTSTPRALVGGGIQAPAQFNLSHINCEGEERVEVHFVVTHAPAPQTLSNYGFVSYQVNGATRTANFNTRADDIIDYVDYIPPVDQAANGLYDVTSGSVTIMTIAGVVTLPLRNPSVMSASCHPSGPLTIMPTETYTSTPTLPSTTGMATYTSTPTLPLTTGMATYTSTPTLRPPTLTATYTSTPTLRPPTLTATYTSTPTLRPPTLTATYTSTPTPP